MCKAHLTMGGRPHGYAMIPYAHSHKTATNYKLKAILSLDNWSTELQQFHSHTIVWQSSRRSRTGARAQHLATTAHCGELEFQV